MEQQIVPVLMPMRQRLDEVIGQEGLLELQSIRQDIRRKQSKEGEVSNITDPRKQAEYLRVMAERELKLKERVEAFSRKYAEQVQLMLVELRQYVPGWQNGLYEIRQSYLGKETPHSFESESSVLGLEGLGLLDIYEIIHFVVWDPEKGLDDHGLEQILKAEKK
ncbi:MAG: hypothetical protein AAF206_04730 [Bacteroidota bacterium]